MDETKQPDPRQRAYFEIDRRERESENAAALHRRPTTRGTDNRRAVEYARIERGHTA
ncbi:hypothetical protein [Falsirhodobacter halotolerans]|uniref:hypothetical protein n=1 Tax=Falsirhodobacter halotolerans TaxID=1146892 RepID=UPI001FD2D80F|nr:hypothetical protein [Falsirhodobacter halotolerans]MCJ8140763.1 hypothetical protein [Falsirhodobacter halotolerans]